MILRIRCDCTLRSLLVHRNPEGHAALASRIALHGDRCGRLASILVIAQDAQAVEKRMPGRLSTSWRSFALLPSVASAAATLFGVPLGIL